jgi:hypothetical protein
MNDVKLYIKILFFLIVLLSLGACAKTLRIEKVLDVETKKKLQISEVSVTADRSVFTNDPVLRSLKSAVLSQLNDIKAQGIPAFMEIMVTKVRIVTRGKRILIGAFGGSNVLDITATIKSRETKKILGVYEVKSNYNPGLSAECCKNLWDPVDDTTSRVAEELVNGIYQ